MCFIVLGASAATDLSASLSLGRERANSLLLLHLSRLAGVGKLSNLFTIYIDFEVLNPCLWTCIEFGDPSQAQQEAQQEKGHLH